MSGDNNSESRSRVIPAWVGTLLVIGIAGAGYLFSTPLHDRLWQTVVFFTAICAGLVLVWRLHSLRVRERKHTQVVVCAQRDLARIISTVSSPQAAWPLCFEIALRVSDFDCGGIYLFDDEQRVIELVYHQGLSAAFVQLASRYTADSPNAQRISDGKSLYIGDDEIQQVAHLRHEGVHAMVVIPIRHQGRILGSLNVGSHRQKQVPDFARHTLETIATEIGNIIVYLRTEEALHRSTQILSESQAIAHVASWSADCQTGTFTASAGGSSLVAWIAGVHTVEDLAAIIHPDDRELVQSSWIAALHSAPLNTDRTYAVEMVYRIWKPCPLSRQNRGLRLCKAVFDFQLRKS